MSSEYAWDFLELVGTVCKEFAKYENCLGEPIAIKIDKDNYWDFYHDNSNDRFVLEIPNHLIKEIINE